MEIITISMEIQKGITIITKLIIMNQGVICMIGRTILMATRMNIRMVLITGALVTHIPDFHPSCNRIRSVRVIRLLRLSLYKNNSQ